ncbi:hypothetical protein GYMLUDRAFT_55667 [Collybiopsis luxurians FD-317 M1]|nr:hypothetical protein GYMLUDRAFT_55667 [Collybiopsis luxurians FD-317 M1]
MDKEKEEYCAASKCFQCDEQGHMARQCPCGKSVTSSNNSPPGMSSNHMDIPIEDNPKELQDLAETTEDITNVTFGMISINESNSESWEILSDCDSIPTLQDVSDSECQSVMRDTQMDNDMDNLIHRLTTESLTLQHASSTGAKSRVKH